MTVKTARHLAPVDHSETRRLAKMVNEIKQAVDAQTEQLASLTTAVQEQAATIKPLADNTPELLEMVRAWKATKELGTTARQFQRLFSALSRFLRNIGAVAIAVVALYLLWKGKFFAMLGLPG